MFERFTDGARRVVVLAQENSRFLNHNYIGTEHLLLGLLFVESGVGCKALEKMGVSLDAVRANVQEIIGVGSVPPTGHIPFTPRAKRVMELSLREALQLGHNYIGTEHLLLGLVREGEGVACQVLVKMGVELNTIRRVVVELIQEDPNASRRSVTEPLPLAVRMSAFETLSAGDMPACPGCRHSLEGHLASRVLPIEGSTAHQLFVVYCRNCGVAIETRIEEASE